MARKKLTKARKTLLIKFESIIGNECYNANIQNWGPGGVFQGEGREFRYPITFRDEEGTKIKKRYVDENMKADADRRLLCVRSQRTPHNEWPGSCASIP
ncbi:hypothetical protein LB524_08180 [Mesorhizobium sp. ESP6-5]|uniref:hypothetical protein n=1 Tax=Mesorhizobium sp. ESP6-5 TaxID=2876623 RepID=UPI001CCFDD08|nr:hypothetical protein [Mesorhizobium sp. ESP6-5]MBZ9755261.1 hypothetical protein [Mesorhizobium sp. ESP6-5]